MVAIVDLFAAVGGWYMDGMGLADLAEGWGGGNGAGLEAAACVHGGGGAVAGGKEKTWTSSAPFPIPRVGG